MNALPPRVQLRRVLAAVTARLPVEFADLLDTERYAVERPALERLTDPAWAQRAAEAMTPEEAGWMSELLLARWGSIDEVQLEPIAAIRAPADVWVGTRAGSVTIEAIVDGLDEGRQLTWSGDVPEGSAGDEVSVTV